ncbi:MAG TPA: metal-dependent hydrolase [Candidatus Acidoferrales bacterium]|nr:metal-dependent hydrolase [Candidatus Acidoferrales bacterium]
MLSMHGHKLTWLGHATFRITTASGAVAVIDPFIEGNPKCPPALKKFDRLDAILVSHGHADHMADAAELAKKFKAPVAGMPELCGWLKSKGVPNVSGMNKGGTSKIGDFEFTMVHALHSAGIEDDGRTIYGGEAAGYVVRLPGGPSIYHAGDTGIFSDMKLIGELYAPDIACLPIGDHYTMGPREAALAIRLLGVHHVVPMHFGTFPVLTGTPEALREATKGIPDLEIHVLKPGESLG